MQLMTASRAEAEKVYIVVKNNEGAVLEPGKVCVFTLTTTDADQGYAAELVDAEVNLTTGLGKPVAGVVETTISTGAVGRLQVWGPANVRASASYDVGTLLVASSINATNQAHVESASQSTAIGAAYVRAVIGYNLEAGPNATNATIQLRMI